MFSYTVQCIVIFHFWIKVNISCAFFGCWYRGEMLSFKCPSLIGSISRGWSYHGQGLLPTGLTRLVIVFLFVWHLRQVLIILIINFYFISFNLHCCLLYPFVCVSQSGIRGQSRKGFTKSHIRAQWSSGSWN